MLFRGQHAGPPAAFVTGETIELSGWKIIKVMLRHIWPRDHPSLKVRVVVAVGLLFGAKVYMDISTILCHLRSAFTVRHVCKHDDVFVIMLP